ncbi:hypothetical protein, partial [Micromonospora sp. LOL_021]|uniref:hypothetical protein n=1 Tax=Micromonospora sp. LOL_021 TaxID=3345417 RepID=UPI003A874199
PNPIPTNGHAVRHTYRKHSLRFTNSIHIYYPDRRIGAEKVDLIPYPSRQIGLIVAEDKYLHRTNHIRPSRPARIPTTALSA